MLAVRSGQALASLLQARRVGMTQVDFDFDLGSQRDGELKNSGKAAKEKWLAA
jgi:hypothetical protein